MDTETGTNLVSDSCGQTPSKTMDRRSKTTRFYGVSFLRGKLKDSNVQSLYDRKRKEFDDHDIVVCCFIMVAVIAIISGISLALAGHFTPKKRFTDIFSGNGTNTQSGIQVVLHYNHMLETFVLSGMVLLAIGIIMFILIITTSLCYTYEYNIQRNKGYKLASNSDTEEMMLIEKKAKDDVQVANGNTQESPAGQFTTLHQHFKSMEHTKTNY